jgi:two-component system, cell cycle response regulator DivK
LKNRILIVEDNPANRELLQDWLEVEGYEVWAVADVKSSYKVLEMDAPDVVLLDINLGAENGLDLVAWMRRKASLNNIPVIAVTAHALATEQERILKAGCVAYLSKPIDFKDLRGQLQKWLQFRAASRQHS